ncbi:biotin--[acetyl-CoA-carboxylase] ligase [Flavobacterium sp. CS20]|jgi:BirA family biotin operon repressor/biotin-[acetyl-CoA-carboxylase] ligase|uniref:biotin--[acetyl-CoA-carboxylase] ligase n=1 Tax=Flavobacterium sp. CS20 TaxID=2775246 RepID=UPI001B3A42C3|nr:biotin--[acetyl-CoA-carboxylase] ligase [Flavobacterium sp. CS20]QTY27224.1 biotin--[acetyl-CoA-carboxylase] ligase [Flavobacterium sp. CS20]
MNIVKVDATTSTNALAKIINKDIKEKKFCLSAEFQTQGRGQLNSSWQSSRSENLMFTVVFNDINLKTENQFALNALVCLGILRVLKAYNIPNLRFKWPNDILSEQFKICGILIENTLNKNLIKTTYIGIGLNVNQTYFENLPKANSLKRIKNIHFDRDELLDKLVDELDDIPKELNLHSVEHIISVYKRYLYNYKKQTRFVLPNGDLFEGQIKDIVTDGQLLVKTNSGIEKFYAHKEISQVY